MDLTFRQNLVQKLVYFSSLSGTSLPKSNLSAPPPPRRGSDHSTFLKQMFASRRPGTGKWSLCFLLASCLAHCGYCGNHISCRDMLCFK